MLKSAQSGDGRAPDDCMTGKSEGARAQSKAAHDADKRWAARLRGGCEPALAHSNADERSASVEIGEFVIFLRFDNQNRNQQLRVSLAMEVAETSPCLETHPGVSNRESRPYHTHL
jgi:hypothetical protein